MVIRIPFIDQMLEHADDRVYRTQFVPCEGPVVEYDRMTPSQVRYYIYYRESLRRNRPIQSDTGYVYLRLCEMISLPENEKGRIPHQAYILANDPNLPAFIEPERLLLDMMVALDIYIWDVTTYSPMGR